MTKARLSRLCYMAGAGFSAAEIAEELGISPGNVYRVLSDFRISLQPKKAGQKSVQLGISASAFADAYELAGTLEMPPERMMGKLLETVLAERTIAVNLLDGVRRRETAA